MNDQGQKIDVLQICNVFAHSVEKTLRNILNVTVDNVQAPQLTSQLEKSEDLYISMLFTGQVYGEFLIGIKKEHALRILGYSFNKNNINSVFSIKRAEIIDSLQEVLNIAAGTTLGWIKKTYAEVSITPPKAIEGNILLSRFEIGSQKIVKMSDSLSCYIYLDQMQLDVASALKKGQAALDLEHSKQEELKRLNRAKTEFLANMSHELRTPLNGILGMIEILKRTPLDTIQLEYTNIISKSGDFLLGIISDILEFSKIEAGKLQIESRPFNLRHSLESVTETLSGEVFGKNLNFTSNISPEIRELYVGDETRIKQILMNLIGNSIKFTPTGQISLDAYLAGKSVILEVADTGIGIPKSKLETIFNSFSQVDVSDNRKYGGSGLGLTITKSLTEAMGGRITVTSEEAKGTKFVIELPLPVYTDKPFSLEEVCYLDLNSYLLSADRDLFAVLNRYLSSICIENRLKSLDPSSALDTKENDTVFIELREWTKLPGEAKQSLLDALIKRQPYVLFFARPSEVQLMASHEGLTSLSRVNYLTLPLTLTQLTKRIKDRPSIRKPKIVASESSTQNEINLQKRVLLVEDNLTNQKVVKAMLKILGYSVDTANDGKEAVDAVKTNHFDLVLMDCQMPIMNGYEATSEIRKLDQENRAKVPIVALTANAFRETKEKCFESGMNEFVTKPIKLDDLAKVVNQILR